MQYFYYFLILFFCTSCGYRHGVGESLASYKTISIPYVLNDQDGRMTSTLIKVISSESGLQYVKCGGDLTLLVDLLAFENEHIGYRYDRKNSGKLRHSIIPTETRLLIVAQVTLIDSATTQPIAGPAKIVATVDFDHDYERTRNGVNVFSLGQLTDYDEAYDAAFKPLYYNLSQKISDFILNI